MDNQVEMCFQLFFKVCLKFYGSKQTNILKETEKKFFISSQKLLENFSSDYENELQFKEYRSEDIHLSTLLKLFQFDCGFENDDNSHENIILYEIIESIKWLTVLYNDLFSFKKDSNDKQLKFNLIYRKMKFHDLTFENAIEKIISEIRDVTNEILHNHKKIIDTKNSCLYEYLNKIISYLYVMPEILLKFERYI